MTPHLPVLAYQKIGTPQPYCKLKNQWTCVPQLKRTIHWLAKHQFTGITPLNLKEKLPPRPVMLVFMGGYQTFYTDVFPLLKHYHLPATVALATNTLNTYNAWQQPALEPWQNILTASQLQEMVSGGLVQVATLGLTGDNLLAQPATLAKNQLAESIYRLKHLYQISPCAIAFWPKSHWDSEKARLITQNLNLPVITSIEGKNPLPPTTWLHTAPPPGVLRLWWEYR